MSIKSEARKLLDVRTRFEQCEQEYENQRLVVHNALVNGNQEFIDVDGFRISHVPESSVMMFSRDGLRRNFCAEGWVKPTLRR
jgi:hypothetical protein